MRSKTTTDYCDRQLSLPYCVPTAPETSLPLFPKPREAGPTVGPMGDSERVRDLHKVTELVRSRAGGGGEARPFGSPRGRVSKANSEVGRAVGCVPPETIFSDI